MKIGVVREEKIPHDYRVPFSPSQLAVIQKDFNAECVIQKSDIRCFKDSEYESAGITLQEDLSDCDYIFGVKEVPITNLINGKTYFFFSHTIKEQAHNQKLMQALLSKNIRMVDYEVCTNDNGQRFVAFGREAGIVGAYNALRAYGLKTKTFFLPLAQSLNGLEHLYEIVKCLPLDGVRLCVTGARGRVCGGVQSVLEAAGISNVSAQQYLKDTPAQDSAVYTALSPCQYIKRSDGQTMVEKDFFVNPEGYESNFLQFSEKSDIYIAAHFWDSRSCKFFDLSDVNDVKKFPLQVISDISCDLDGPIPTTIRECTLDNPNYEVCRITGKELSGDEKSANSITVTAVDNCPSAIPKDASVTFGAALLENLIPCLAEDTEYKKEVVQRATICKDGELQGKFKYLQTYAKGLKAG